ncbi:hypothetical protein Tco_0983118 [Tanacetum coccineum]
MFLRGSSNCWTSIVHEVISGVTRWGINVRLHLFEAGEWGGRTRRLKPHRPEKKIMCEMEQLESAGRDSDKTAQLAAVIADVTAALLLPDDP